LAFALPKRSSKQHAGKTSSGIIYTLLFMELWSP
jgi:hypothetical protein